jgi:hypothetical protein
MITINILDSIPSVTDPVRNEPDGPRGQVLPPGALQSFRRKTGKAGSGAGSLLVLILSTEGSASKWMHSGFSCDRFFLVLVTYIILTDTMFRVLLVRFHLHWNNVG